LCRQLVFVYVLLYLIQGFAQNFGVQFVGTVTNKLNELVHSSANGPVAGGPDAQAEGSGRPRKEGFLTTFLKRYSLSRFLDRLSLEQTYFAWVILAIMGIGLAVPVQWLGAKMDLLMSNQLRSELFGRVLQKPPGFFHENDPGKVNAIVNTMPVEMQMALRKITVDQIPQLILLAGTAAMLIDNLTQLSGDIPVLGFRVPTVAAPPCIVVVGFGFCYLILKMKDQLQGGGRRLQKAMLVLNTLVTGAAQAPEEIQALRAEPLFSRKLDLALNEASNARLNQQFTVGKLNLLGQLPEFVVQVLFLGIGVYVAHSAAQSSGSGQVVGNIIAIFGLAPRLISPINALSGSMLMVLQSWPSIETVLATIGVLTRSDRALESSNLVHLAPTIEARNVVFSYSDDSGKVFDGISFRIPAGLRTGLVAKLGQGKTTFFKLALRFYDPSSGELLLGGKPTTAYSATDLREKIAMLSQFPSFFHDTLRENLRMAMPGATDAEIEAVCRQTGIWEVLSKKKPPVSLDSNIGAAQSLSGGQKKLLALARCLLRNPDLLFLDEPGANVDNEEKFGEMLRNISEATVGKTVVVVDHDVNWLLQFCDYFVVLDQGKVVEEGTMRELLRRKGMLYGLYMVTQGPRAAEIAACIAEPGSSV